MAVPKRKTTKSRAGKRRSHLKINSKNITKGDIVFWEGHVGIMIDKINCIHANAYHMKVTIENIISFSPSQCSALSFLIVNSGNIF